MADPILPPDFGEFLRLLNAHQVDYLIVGGYAVAFHGHPRATAWRVTVAAATVTRVEPLLHFDELDRDPVRTFIHSPG